MTTRIHHTYRSRIKHRRAPLPPERPPASTSLNETAALEAGRYFSHSIREWREKRGWTVADSASDACISPKRWKSWESGYSSFKPPTSTEVTRIARATGLNEAILIFEVAFDRREYERREQREGAA